MGTNRQKTAQEPAKWGSPTKKANRGIQRTKSPQGNDRSKATGEKRPNTKKEGKSHLKDESAKIGEFKVGKGEGYKVLPKKRGKKGQKHTPHGV